MTQYCRYCNNLVCGDTNYCTAKSQEISDSAVKRPNKCHDFEFNSMDALGENEKGYQPREPKQKQCDGQMSLF